MNLPAGDAETQAGGWRKTLAQRLAPDRGVMLTFYVLLILVAVFADAVLSDEHTLWVRVFVLGFLGAVAVVEPTARRLTGILTVALLFAIAVASLLYAWSSPAPMEASGPMTAEFDVEACRIKATTAISAGQSVTVVFVLPAPGDSGGPPVSTTLAVKGTAVTPIEARATACPTRLGGPMVRIRVERGEAAATAKDFVRGLETETAIHILSDASP